MRDVTTTRSIEAIAADIDALTAQRGYIFALSLVLFQSNFVSSDLSPLHSATLSFQESSLLLGLFAKHHPDLTEPNEADLKAMVEDTFQLFGELHIAMQNPMREAFTPPAPGANLAEEFEKAFGRGEVLREPIFYGGSGVYDHQYLLFAPIRYNKDRDWINQQKGIDIEDCVAIASHIKSIHNEKATTPRRLPSLLDYASFCLDVFSFKPEDIEAQNQSTIAEFLSCFSAIPGQVNAEFNTPGEYNIIESRPIIALPNATYFAPMTVDLARSTYESPFY